MAVLVDGLDERRERGRARRHVIVRPFTIAPPVVSSAAPRRLVVNFLPLVLTHVADDERARAAPPRIVEAVPPRVAQPEAPDLASRGNRNAVEKRIVGRNHISS